MRIDMEYVLRLTRRERRTIETALWLMQRRDDVPAEAKEARDLYDRFAGLIPEPAAPTTDPAAAVEAALAAVRASRWQDTAIDEQLATLLDLMRAAPAPTTEDRDE